MSFFAGDSRLYAPLFGDADLAALLSDEASVARMVQTEAALARVQTQLGLIPAGAAEAISALEENFAPDLDALAAGVAHDGLPVIALLGQLRQQLGPEAAPWLHWGATTQDILDTALVLGLREALEVLEGRLLGVVRALAALADRHRHTVMAGRTHSQQALPTTFGLKVAGWLAPLLRWHERLTQLRPRLLVVQFGGAAGTLASLGTAGLEVQAALARELGLGVPLLPWHTGRDTLAELAGWLSGCSGSLAKMSQDIILLTQTEVGEVRESADTSRGGSSTMPQKSNPVISELVVAAARSCAGLLSGMHHALIQEHERATHGWQLEWLSLPPMLALCGSSLRHSLDLARNLVVDAARMEANVQASGGLMLAETLSFALSGPLGRARAGQLVKAAVQTAVKEGRPLVAVLREMSAAELQSEGQSLNWDNFTEANTLGTSEEMIDRVLEAAARVNGAT
ncbi:3-carboxy-cis,cis-muconate cycloisomerase [Deinococcus radiomollis]|uniref:3-carboxy-cis,cis-muconate cycloisomerase n=1 Tax=Deinococcus radiomollis TaxID=468916 RepID=UPI0038924D0E